VTKTKPMWTKDRKLSLVTALVITIDDFTRCY
jgi:hypothetical protein